LRNLYLVLLLLLRAIPQISDEVENVIIFSTKSTCWDIFISMGS
jgi:hypothetical protein